MHQRHMGSDGSNASHSKLEGRMRLTDSLSCVEGGAGNTGSTMIIGVHHQCTQLLYKGGPSTSSPASHCFFQTVKAIAESLIFYMGRVVLKSALTPAALKHWAGPGSECKHD